MAVNMGTAVAYLELDTSNFTKGFQSAYNDLKVFGDKSATAEQKLKGLSSAFRTTGSTLTKGVTIPLLGIGTAAVASSTTFESAFAGVRKTVDATEEQFKSIKSGIEDLSTVTASSAEDIAEVAENAGQLGVRAEDILKFTETMVRLGDSTNIAASDAATALAQLFNITGESIDNVDKFGSTIVELGNNAATTENDIMNFSSRIAGSASQVGFTSQQILALSTSLASVGLNAEAGGTAISTVISNIDKAVATNADSLETWANTVGMSIDEFKDAWETDAYGALQKVIEGMGDASRGGENLNILLEDLGITGIRTSDTMKRLSGASDDMSKYLDMANSAWDENNALVEESDKRYETTESKISQMKETLKKAARTIGDELLPIFQKAVDFVSSLANKFASLDENTKEFIVKFGLFAAALGPVLLVLSKVSGAISSLGGLFGKIGLKTFISTWKQFGLQMALLGSKEGGLLGKIIGAFKFMVSPIGAVIAVMAVLAGAFKTLWDTNDEFKEQIMQTWNTIVMSVNNFTQRIVDEINKLGFIFEDISDVFNSVVDALKEAWLAFCNVIASPIITQAFNSIKDILQGVLDVVVDAVSIIVGLLTGDMEQVKESVGDIFRAIFTTISDVASNIVSAIGEMVSNVIELLGFEYAAQRVQEFVDNVSEFIRTLPETILEIVGEVVEFFTVTMPNAFNTFVNETIPKTVNGIVKWFNELPYRIGYIIGELIGYIYLFGKSCIDWVTSELPKIIQNIVDWFAKLPGKIWEWLSETISKVIQWGFDTAEEGKQSAADFVKGVVNWFKRLPVKINEWLLNTIQKVATWATNMKNKAKTTATEFVTSFINFIKELPSKVWNIIKTIPDKVKLIGGSLKQAGKGIFNKLWEGIKSIGDSILGWVSGFAKKIAGFVSGIIKGFKSVTSKASEAKTAAQSVNGSHANGLDYVPFNGYIAELHEGERVLTKQENKEYNRGNTTGSGGDTYNFYNTKPDPYEYARQMKRAKKELLYGV